MLKKKKLSLTIAHNLYLTKEQRYKLYIEDESEIEVIGTSVPVWCRGTLKDWYQKKIRTSEPAEEIFCRYVLSSKSGNTIMEMLADGYRIYLSADSIRQRLLDIPDMGSEYLSFIAYGTTLVKSRPCQVINFVTIQDYSILEKSLLT